MAGYLDTNNTNNASVTFTDIPYPAYDVYVYFGANTNGRTGQVTDGETTYSFRTASNAGDEVGAYVQTFDEGNGFPSANYAVFSDQTDSSMTVTYLRGSGNGGIHAIQIVPTLSPYEFWALNNGVAGLPDEDADNDGLSNLLEFALFTDPNDSGSRTLLDFTREGGTLSFDFTEAQAASGLSVIPEWSRDLITWNRTGFGINQVSSDAFSRSLEAEIEVSGEPDFFIRLIVEEVE